MLEGKSSTFSVSTVLRRQWNSVACFRRMDGIRQIGFIQAGLKEERGRKEGPLYVQ